eukprot:TRINITY_DN4284_c0_g1_i1.p1 TRINITY_DN4284_c0_g1~~TRINITY_DN4284_c0_g1_i1.p1  ORF type:complete len:388 (+),score=78.86 TRINITY_DN4284_c0_g1_i1:500-1663(+)
MSVFSDWRFSGNNNNAAASVVASHSSGRAERNGIDDVSSVATAATTATVGQGSRGGLVSHTGAGQGAAHEGCSALLFDPTAPACPVQVRDPSMKKQCRPDYWILGTRKGGTTSMHYYLCQHPDVFQFRIKNKPNDGEIPLTFVPEKKDTDFLETYHKNYNMVPDDVFVGESTVSRLVSDAPGIASICGTEGHKFIVLMRDPIERCHSHMLMKARNRSRQFSLEGDMTAELEKEIRMFKGWERKYPWMLNGEANPPTVTGPRGKPQLFNCINEGIYVVHLRRYLSIFPAGSMRAYFSEDLYNPERSPLVLKDALAFIGLDPEKFDTNVVKNVKNSRGTTDLPANMYIEPATIAKMEAIMEPYNKQLEDLLGVELPWLKNHDHLSTERH